MCNVYTIMSTCKKCAYLPYISPHCLPFFTCYSSKNILEYLIHNTLISYRCLHSFIFFKNLVNCLLFFPHFFLLLPLNISCNIPSYVTGICMPLFFKKLVNCCLSFTLNFPAYILQNAQFFCFNLEV